MGILFDFDHPLARISTNPYNSATESSASSSDNLESESEEDGPTPKAAVMEVEGITTLSAPDARSPAGSSKTLPTTEPSDDGDSDSESGRSISTDDSSSASSCDIDSGGASTAGKTAIQGGGKPKKAKITDNAGTSTVGPSHKLNYTRAVAKRRRTDEAGNSAVALIVQRPKASNTHQKGHRKSPPRRTNTSFSRIKVDEIKFADERLKDNTFESRKAAINDYGTKANADLIVTRGASFRKEKNKKKRGSYRGGEITVSHLTMRRHRVTDSVSI